jgi:hypothetical protein
VLRLREALQHEREEAAAAGGGVLEVGGEIKGRYGRDIRKIKGRYRRDIGEYWRDIREI